MSGRNIKCQKCGWAKFRYFGAGVLSKPCPDCGSRVTFAENWLGDPKVTPDPKLVQEKVA